MQEDLQYGISTNTPCCRLPPIYKITYSRFDSSDNEVHPICKKHFEEEPALRTKMMVKKIICIKCGIDVTEEGFCYTCFPEQIDLPNADKQIESTLQG